MIRKDKSTGKWMYQGKIYKNGNVVKEYKKRGFEKKSDAKQAEIKYLKEMNEKLSRTGITWDELVTEFEAYLITQVKESSYISDVSIYNKTPKYVRENYSDVAILQRYINECDQKFSKRHVEKIFYCLKKLMRYAVFHDYLQNNPMERVYKDQRKNERPKEIEFWEPWQFERFIEYEESKVYKAAYCTLYYMGIRKGEMQALTWKDINFNAHTMTINKIVSHKALKGSTHITTPKTENSYRTITIPKKLYEILIDLYDTYRKEGYIDDMPNAFVFGGSRPLPSETLRRRFNNNIEEANKNADAMHQIPRIKIHGLRHSHASFLINNMDKGFTDFDIAQRLGDTVETLHNVYAHWFDKADKKIVDFMDSM